MVTLTINGQEIFSNELYRLGIKNISKVDFRYFQDEIHLESPLFVETIKIKNVSYEYNNMGKKYASYCYNYLIEKYPEVLL